jgi:hypothetical protein
MSRKKTYSELCRVDQCGKLRDGRHSVCGMHRSRLSRYKSIDVPIFDYPAGIAHECKIHGLLNKEYAYKNPKTGHYSCVQCRRETDRRFADNHPDKDLNNYKTYIYVGNDKSIKISKNEYELLLHSQNGVCAICKKEEKITYRHKKHGMLVKRLAIDHVHYGTKKIRGLLCQLCNQALGGFKDSIETLQSAIEYLKKHKECEE